jgi:hypothetical protein
MMGRVAKTMLEAEHLHIDYRQLQDFLEMLHFIKNSMNEEYRKKAIGPLLKESLSLLGIRSI